MVKYLPIILMLSILPVSGAYSAGNGCCYKSQISYCDVSAGRYVCDNGDYSSCYCSKQAVINSSKVVGCCLWKGGVFKVEAQTNLVICNNGGVSAECSIR